MQTKSQARHRVLVVDDTPAIHEDIRRLLAPSLGDGALADVEADLFGGAKSVVAEQDYQIDSAMQGQEALNLVIQACTTGRPYSMAFVDVRMPPGWDGIETIRRIWEHDPDLETVICTAYSDKSWSEIIDTLGVTDRLLILKKPFDSIEVQQIARALTTKWSMQRQIAERMQDLGTLVADRTAELTGANESLHTEMERRLKVESELGQAQKLEAVGQLASGIAHEINTPIQYVGDNLRFLQEAFGSLDKLLGDVRETFDQSLDVDSMRDRFKAAEAVADLEYLRADVPGAFTQTLDGVERVATIVRAMKEFGHPDQREQSQLDLNRKIENTLIVATSEYKLVAEVQTDLGEVPPVLCHPGDVGQILLNLIVNAAHAIADARGDSGGLGQIGIKTRVDGSDVVVAISDDGCGMPEHVAAKVFEPFYTTKEVGRGTGQGLAIAHNCVVAKHGGSLTFESEVGTGTTFFVRLPIEGKPVATTSEDPQVDDLNSESGDAAPAQAGDTPADAPSSHAYTMRIATAPDG